tara:strand:+ start:359 stop:613 length:255 start_codon:yes stop_codon:yes gene_type:complete
MKDVITDISSLLEESLHQPPLGETKNFIWLTTPIGIAALNRNKSQLQPIYETAITEGLEISIDLSREEKEFHQTDKGMMLIFYS